MKRVKSIIGIVLFLAMFAITANAQDSKKQEAEFKVKGVCNDCKMRIENAAYIKGVKFAEWNKETDVIKVIYNPLKVELEQIHQSIADAGHTTDKIEASKEAYKKLPQCCAYEDGVEKH